MLSITDPLISELASVDSNLANGILVRAGQLKDLYACFVMRGKYHIGHM